MSTHCAVSGCSNGGYRLSRWKQKRCEIHGIDQGSCPCKVPFSLLPFPGRVKDPERRKIWKNLINRVDENNKAWSPGAKSRVCSEHFDGDFPYPVLKLNYPSAGEKVSRLFPERMSKRRKLCYSDVKKPLPEPEPEVYQEFNLEPEPDFQISDLDDNDWKYKCSILEQKYKEQLSITEHLEAENCSLKNKVDTMDSVLHDNMSTLTTVERQLKAKSFVIKRYQTYFKCTKEKIKKYSKPLSKKLLTTNAKVLFYTGCENLESFNQLHDICIPYLQRKWQGKRRTSLGKLTRNFKKKTQKLGRKTKLSSQDELLMTLMRLRLGLTVQDLADRFDTSVTHVSNTFTTWCKLMSKVLSSLIFVPNQGQLNFTRPQRFENVRDTSQIIDCFECFIETPKSPALQKLTWSEYKHHNTVKVLVGCTPNSLVSFISDGYPGSISDKAIVNHSKFLDSVAMYSSIMADKGFNIEKECLAKNIHLVIPPGKRGNYQMSRDQVSKTKKVANRRILIEQVIRNVKGFKILTHELPITLLPMLDDIVKICGALVNLKPPILDD